VDHPPAGTDRAVTARLRVTAVCGAGVLGGAELWLTSLLAATDRLAVDAVVLAEGPLAQELGRHCVSVQVMATGPHPLGILRAAIRLAGRLRADRPDVVLANGIKAAAVVVPAALAAGVRCVWVKHDHSFDGHPLTALVARLADGVVAGSPTLAEAAAVAHPVVVVPPRAARAPLPRSEARAVLGAAGLAPDDARPVVAVVGRIVRYKGIEDAVQALGLAGGERWRLAVIGDADPAEPGERARLERLAAATGVADRVVFTGPLPDAGGLLAGVDAIGVLTKPGEKGPGREGFATVATEAMLAGVPVVTTTGGPVTQRLAGRAGLSLAPGDPAAVAAALGVLADPQLRASMGAAGLELSAAHPDAAMCADTLVRELARIAARPGAGRLDGPPVSVVTTVLNEAAATDRLLGRLAGQLAHPEDEIVVVDGGSGDATAVRVGQWSVREPRIRLIVEPGAGISAGRNAGVRASRNAFIACTDAGCDPDPGWLSAFRAAAAERGTDQLFTGVYRVAARGPSQLAQAAVGYPDPDELRHPTVLSRWYGRLLGRCFDPALPTGRSVAFGVGVWRRAGGFPEELQTAEDVLFGARAVAAGVPASLVAGAEVVWTQRSSAWATARMYYRYGHGSGRSRDGRLLGRDLARLAAYALAPWVVWQGGLVGCAVVALAAAAYLSLPVMRVLKGRAGSGSAGSGSAGSGSAGSGSVGETVAAVGLVPIAAAVRDLAKVAGALHGLARAR
jgi:glycosyltransferase involved in cell wall biosynthesis/GT2 family glycosyltransferase